MAKTKRSKFKVRWVPLNSDLFRCIHSSGNPKKCDSFLPNGFSLLELILVMFLLAVISGLAVPNFRHSFSSLQLKQTTNDLAYCMRYAQSRAVSRGQAVVLQFDGQLSSYWLAEGSSTSEEDAEDFQKISGRMGRVFSIPSNILIESEGNTVQFYPDGTIGKTEINVCRLTVCMIISTKIQRGNVHVFESE